METTAVTLAALMGRLGTGIGGMISPQKGRWQGMLGLATAGMMLTIAAVELLPEAMELSGQWIGFLCFALLCALTGSPMALGALVGQQMAVTALGVGGCLALAVGAIVFVVAEEVLPEGYDDGSRPRLPGLWVALGFVLALGGLILV